MRLDRDGQCRVSKNQRTSHCDIALGVFELVPPSEVMALVLRPELVLPLVLPAALRGTLPRAHTASMNGCRFIDEWL